MTDPLEHLLGLVAAGRLSAEDAAPILEALQHTPAGPGRRPSIPPRPDAPAGQRNLRVEIRERGRVVVDLTIPGSLAGLAAAVPGMPPDFADRIRDALAAGVAGRIVDVAGGEGDGVSVRIEQGLGGRPVRPGRRRHPGRAPLRPAAALRLGAAGAAEAWAVPVSRLARPDSRRRRAGEERRHLGRQLGDVGDLRAGGEVARADGAG